MRNIILKRKKIEKLLPSSFGRKRAYKQVKPVENFSYFMKTVRINVMLSKNKVIPALG